MASRLLRTLLLASAVVVALATAYAITSLRAKADDARMTQTTLADIRAHLNEASALEWEARAIGGADEEIRQVRRTITAELRLHFRKLSRIDPDNASDHGQLRELLTGYDSAVDDMFREISRDDLQRAEEIDEGRVDPAFDALSEKLASTESEEGAQAVGIYKWTAFWTYFSLCASALALIALFWRFRRIEQKRTNEYSRRLEHEATHDHLTGLPNRRRLMDDLDRPGERRLLAFFDLDGFKAYNDTYGHVEGDLMLERLSRKLADAVAGRGVAYRLGGDEFCVVGPLVTDEDGDALVIGSVDALTEDGEGFQVRASWGCVRMPAEATSSAAALTLADQRMYHHKGSGRSSARQQTRDLVLRVLAERRPDLHEHVSEVAALALATGARLGLGEIELDDLVRAAELHDIGKIAIPDAIIDKPAPLDDEEWRFMRRHTLIGEGMLSAAPALTSVAKVVRSSHERFDGAGYPDGLAGAAIPLASRIVFVCDAFHAMTSARPYGPVMAVDEALTELGRCAGSQFDPEVVAAFRAARAAAVLTLVG